jgi:hypothetical protein
MTSLSMSLAAVSGSSWELGWEGLSPVSATVVLVLLLGATVAGNWWPPGRPRTPRRLWVTGLRVLSCFILALLLARPVIRLTREEPVRQPLAVLIDGSESMNVADRREEQADRVRAGIATGALIPNAKLDESGAPSAAQSRIPRTELLKKLALNQDLDLWEKISKQADLVFHGFGRRAVRLGEGTTDVPKIFAKAQTGETATAIGDSLQEVLQEPRQRGLGGILLITDGNSNAGASALEAATACRERGVPLFIYGVGVSSPRDVIVHDVQAPKLAFAGERMEVRARISAAGMAGRRATVTLKGDGVEIESREILLEEREVEIALHAAPKTPGELRVEVSIPPLEGEASTENNHAGTAVRITDRKFRVLLIEQEPRWDFRYLLDYLERDPRLEVKCVMIKGEPGLDALEDSPFLPSLPDTREAYFTSQVLILGDVNPQDLGEHRMQIIADWVEAGGGIIFLAGPNFSPNAYTGTPLEPLLPIVPDSSLATDQFRAAEPYPLRLTRTGEQSPYLQMDPDPVVNREIWDRFPGVRWVAPISRVKPGAEVLLVDPRPESSGRYGMLPVFAMQGFGSGTCVYFGTDETYRWRSRTGEKYYSILWGQIMQSLSLQLLEGASTLTQLRTDRRQYAVGDTVHISGTAWTEGFEPYLSPSLDGTVTWQGDRVAQSSPVVLHSSGKNSYRGEFVPQAGGVYTFATSRDPAGTVRFEVVEASAERNRTALDERMLRGMAEAAGGSFLREEDLHRLPEMIAAKSATVATFQKIDFCRSAWMLTALLALLAAEWLIRKLTRLN